MANSNKYDVGFDKELVDERNSKFFPTGCHKRKHRKFTTLF